MIKMFLMLAALGASLSMAAVEEHEASAPFVVHLLDYIARDYSGAVRGGKVISASEYQEQLEFIQAAIKANDALDMTKGQPAIRAGLLKVFALIQSKASAAEVEKEAHLTEAQLIKVAGIQVAPSRLPSLHRGKESYQKNCANCHGANGQGDGPAGKNLKPQPANFLDGEHMENISPFQAFNSIRLGVPGTAMPEVALPTEEVWDLAFYVVSIRHEDLRASIQGHKIPPVSLKEVATKSDRQLSKSFAGSESDQRRSLVAVRLQESAIDETRSFIDLAKRRLNEALELFQAGNQGEAKSRAVMAYLDGVEPLEPRLRAKDSDFTLELERRMAEVRSSIDAGATFSETRAKVATAVEGLDQAQTLLLERKSSPSLTFSIAAGIFLREAFEAVLLLIALLGVIRSVGAKKAAWFVHAGWILALVAGLIAWFFSGWVMQMSGLGRELLEGIISLIAVGVLLYLGFWLHRKTEIGRWQAFLQQMVESALKGKNLLILSSIAFMAVFREAFETVLFLRAVLLEAGEGQQGAVAAGVLFSFVLVLVLATLLVRFSARLPIRRLFDVSSWIMMLLAFVLIGKALHSFQETGWISVTQLPVQFRSELFGVYSTYQTFLAQIFVLGVCIAFWRQGKKGVKQGQPA